MIRTLVPSRFVVWYVPQNILSKDTVLGCVQQILQFNLQLKNKHPVDLGHVRDQDREVRSIQHSLRA